MEFRRQVQIHSSWDVIVCGAGASGIAAAVSAARQGMKVMVLERYGVVGGGLTLGNVTTIMGTVAKGSIRDELDRLLASPDTATGIDNEEAKACSSSCWTKRASPSACRRRSWIPGWRTASFAACMC